MNTLRFLLLMIICVSMLIIARASVDSSGTVLMYMYIMSPPYMYSAHVCQLKIVWPVVLEAIVSLCNKMGQSFQVNVPSQILFCPRGYVLAKCGRIREFVAAICKTS